MDDFTGQKRNKYYGIRAQMLTNLLKLTIAKSAQKPWLVVVLAAFLTVLALGYTSQSFDMTTDTGDLISAKTGWRMDEAALEKAFTARDSGGGGGANDAAYDSMILVVDGKTPELAEDAAVRLATAINGDKQHFVGAKRPDAGDFFARNGLLFASLDEVKSTTSQLIDAQPLLGALAADPSLRGVAKALDTAATGAVNGEKNAVARLEKPLSSMSLAMDNRLAGRAAWFSWTNLFANGKGQLAPPTRRIVQVAPQLDFGDLEPGSAAYGAVMALLSAEHLDAEHGIRVGITGEVPLADEEFASIRDNIGLIGAFMAAMMMLVLYFATKSVRMVAAIMGTIIAGLMMTLALGLVAVGRLNLISLAFIPLFVGLGVDFGIQVAVRFNAERRDGAAPLPALDRVAAAIGEPLLMAAAAIVLALGAFLPTEYIGIAELGVIAGMGMVIAFILNVTLLPALLILLRPKVPAADVGWRGAAPFDRWLEVNRHKILWSFALSVVVTVAMLPLVKFDFNPLNLRNPESPAMKGLGDLLRDADRTPNTIAILAPNLAAADRLADRLAKLPEVSHTITLSSFIPEGQSAKLALIEDASFLLDSAINPFDLPPDADDASTVAALNKAAGALRNLSVKRPDSVGEAAGRLADSFARLAAGTPSQRQSVAEMLVPPLNTTLNSLRSLLQASVITRDTLPEDMRDGWLARDGRAKIEVAPAGNSVDNAVLLRFTAAVRKVAPKATGLPVATQEAAHTVAFAFIHAGILALTLVSLLLYAVLRSAREVAFTLAPVVLSGFLTLGSCVVIGQPLNFANIIAFPLLFGVGVAFHIYFVMAWRSGVGDLLQTSLARAVVCSALATGSAFGALWFSHHPGTASMGLILMISLIWTLVCALIFEPALLGPVEKREI